MFSLEQNTPQTIPPFIWEILPCCFVWFCFNIQTQLPKLNLSQEEGRLQRTIHILFFPQAQVLFAWQLQLRAHRIKSCRFVYFTLKKTGKLEKTVKPQFRYSCNPAVIPITYCRRHFHIIDVTFTPHFQRQSLKKKLAFPS